MRSRAAIIAAAMLLAALAASGCGGQTPASTGAATVAGASFADAIKVGSVGEERDILNRTSCDDGSFFRVAQLHIQQVNGRYYDIVDAECVKGSEKRQFYFDVTSCFPCKN
jgi:hypothetical protein